MGSGWSGPWRPASTAPSLRPPSPPGRDGVHCGTRRRRPRPAPAKNRERRGVRPCGSPRGFSPPLFLPAAPARGTACGAVRGTEGAPLPVSPLPHPLPLSPAASHSEGAAPRLSRRAEVLIAAGAAGSVRPGRGEMLLFNPLPGPQGAWLSAASREAFSAQRHRPFPPPQVPVPSRVCGDVSAPRARACQGQDLAPRLKYPQRPSRTPSLPACPLCGWLRRRDAVRCQPMVTAVSGGGCAPWAGLGSSAVPQHPRQGCKARLLGLCASAGPRLLARALAELWQPCGSPSPAASHT